MNRMKLIFGWVMGVALLGHGSWVWGGEGCRDDEVCGNPVVLETYSGHVFVQDRSLPALGDAWRDESGVIWGDVVWSSDGQSIEYMHHYLQAQTYCQSLGAELPSEQDFERLRSYMGATRHSSKGYTPQVLPHLKGYDFWSSKTHGFLIHRAFGFSGSLGQMEVVDRKNLQAVRCVLRQVVSQKTFFLDSMPR